MLQVHYIKDNKETVLAGLAKRNFKNAESTIDAVLKADEDRKSTQAALDAILAKSNKISKEIGILFKSGEPQKANVLKEKTGALKEESKQLTDKLAAVNVSLQDLLYTIPNVPNVIVPAGTSEEDNETVFEEGVIP